MTFADALKAMKDGKGVKRPDWDFPLKIVIEKRLTWGIAEPYLTLQDMIAEDWEISHEA